MNDSLRECSSRSPRPTTDRFIELFPRIPVTVESERKKSDLLDPVTASADSDEIPPILRENCSPTSRCRYSGTTLSKRFSCPVFFR